MAPEVQRAGESQRQCGEEKQLRGPRPRGEHWMQDARDVQQSIGHQKEQRGQQRPRGRGPAAGFCRHTLRPRHSALTIKWNGCKRVQAL